MLRALSPSPAVVPVSPASPSSSPSPLSSQSVKMAASPTTNPPAAMSGPSPPPKKSFVSALRNQKILVSSAQDVLAAFEQHLANVPMMISPQPPPVPSIEPSTYLASPTPSMPPNPTPNTNDNTANTKDTTPSSTSDEVAPQTRSASPPSLEEISSKEPTPEQPSPSSSSSSSPSSSSTPSKEPQAKANSEEVSAPAAKEDSSAIAVTERSLRSQNHNDSAPLLEVIAAAATCTDSQIASDEGTTVHEEDLLEEKTLDSTTAEAEDEATKKADEKTEVSISLHCSQTKFGDRVFMVGEWVDWELERALELTTTPDQWPIWRCKFKAINLTCSEYKYFILSADGKTKIWEVFPAPPVPPSEETPTGLFSSSDDCSTRNRLFLGRRNVEDTFGEILTEQQARELSLKIDSPIPVSTLAKSQFKVCKAAFRGEIFAMKVFPLVTPKAVKQAMNEAEILSKLDHPAIVRIVMAYYDDSDDVAVIVEEFLPRGSLAHLMYKENRKFNIIQRLRILLQVARALEYLHSQGLIHRDVKSPNVLLDDNLNAKLCDFGTARREASRFEKMTKIGTPLWMAPEVFMSRHYDCKADIYSMGVLMYEVMEQELPSDRLDPCSIRPQANCLSKLIRQCLDMSPSHRPDATEVKNQIQGSIAEQCRRILFLNNVQPTREALFAVYEEYKQQLPW